MVRFKRFIACLFLVACCVDAASPWVFAESPATPAHRGRVENREAERSSPQIGALSAPQLADLGLESLRLADDSLGNRVRGAAAAYGQTGGMSFVSGMLYEPTTGSNVRATSTQSSNAALEGVNGFPAWNWPTLPAQAMQVSGLSFGFNMGSGGQTAFSGAVFGVAAGRGAVGH